MGHVLRKLSLYPLILILSWALVCQPVAAALFSFGIKDEQELGRKFNVLVRARMPLVEDPEIKLYVQGIVEKLAQAIPPQPFPFQTSVLLHPSMNAFAVPGGYIFVHTGLIMQLEHESELAAVLAHELAHISQRHIASRMEKASIITIATLVGALAGAFLGGGAAIAGSFGAGQSAMLKYSRMDENESDQIGMQYLIKAGYRPQGMQGAFEKMRRKQWASGLDIPEYLSTHPDLSTRITEIYSRIQTLDPSINKRKDADTQFLRAKTLIWAQYGELDAAISYFKTSKQPPALNFLGQAILAERKNQVGEAEKLFLAALKLNPQDSLLNRELGRFYFTKGDNRAPIYLEKALQLDRRDVMAQFYYARYLSASNQPNQKNKAHTYFAELLRYLPEDSEIHYYYGRSLGETGQVFRAYLHLAYAALYQNDRKKTKNWLDKAKTSLNTPTDQAELQKFEDAYQARQEYWK